MRHRKFSEDDGEVHTKCLIINGTEYWAAWMADEPDRYFVTNAPSEHEAKRLLFELFNNLTNNIKPTK